MSDVGSGPVVARLSSVVRVCAWLGDATKQEIARLLDDAAVRHVWQVNTLGASSVKRDRDTTQCDVVFHLASSVSEMRRAWRDGVNRLLIDPTEVCHDSVWPPSVEVLHAMARWKRGRVVLTCRPVPNLLRSVHAISAVVPSRLVLLGVDGAESLLEGLRLDDPHDSVVSVEDVLRAAEAWPTLVQEAVRIALAAPADWPVKRVAARANVSRRTLERYFEDAGLPGPAAVLGHS